MESSAIIGDILEVFVVRAKAIDFFGALIAVKEHRAAVRGTVRFGNGETLFFSSPGNDRSILSAKLMSISRNIAELYSTEVVHQSVHDPGRARRN